MNPRLKRVLLISGFVLVVLGMAFGLYWLFFRAPEPEAPPTPTPGAPGELPTPGAAGPPPSAATPTQPGLPTAPGVPRDLQLPEGIPTTERTQVVRDQVTQEISMSPSGLRGYNPSDGRFYRISPDGELTQLSEEVFFNVESVDWGNHSDEAIINYPDGSNIYYNFSSGEQVTLPAHWEDFSFAPNDNQIAAKSIGNNESNRFLVISNPDGTNARPVEHLGSNQDKMHVDWSPNNQIVGYSFTGRALGFDREEVLMIGQNQENFKGLVVEGRGFIPNWSPDGSEVLYSVYHSSDGYRPSLWVSGAVGDQINDNRRNLQIQTWADKCAWQNNTTVICGVPTSLGEGAGLQREIFQTTPDEIYSINLQTGTVTNLGQPAGGGSVKTMTITEDGRTALFTDVATGRLVRFDL